jgi:hypothetical protein
MDAYGSDLIEGRVVLLRGLDLLALDVPLGDLEVLGAQAVREVLALQKTQQRRMSPR